MDPFTEKLLERTRARRENLQKKMADRPNAANRPMAKRPREPLADTNSVLSEPVIDKGPQPSSKPSPSKRLCSGENVHPAVGEENQEPMAARPAAPMLSDPPTNKKPPVAPGGRQSSSSAASLERAASRPEVQPQQVQPQQVQPQQVQLKSAHPEPEKMVVTPAQDPKTRQEEMVTASPAPQGKKEDPLENQVPCATGMRSRLQRLADQRKYWDGTSSSDVPADGAPLSPPKRQVEVPPAAPPASSCGAPVGRKGRLANLAATIGSWEDDLSHANIPKESAKDKPQANFPKYGAACTKPSAAEAKGSAASGKFTPSTNQAVYCPAKPSRLIIPESPQKADVHEAKSALQAVTSPLKSSKQAATFAHSPQKSLNQGAAFTHGPPKSSNQAVSFASSPQKSHSHVSDLQSSPQKSGPSSAAALPQSPLKSQAISRGLNVTASPQKPELATKPVAVGQGSAPQEKAPAGGPGVKSFLERFGERCQQRTNPGSPAGGASQTVTPAGTPSVTPNTRLVQERLRAAQAANTTCADLTQRQKMERESELAKIRSRFQNGNNMWKNKEEATETKKSPEIKEQPVQPVEIDIAPSEPQGDFRSLSAEKEDTSMKRIPPGNCRAVSPPALTSSPLRAAAHAAARPGDDSPAEEEVFTEVESNVDQSINSAVINELFDGVLEQSESEDEEEDPLNISSMSLLTPLADTVAAVIKSPDRRMMTSTPAGSFCIKSPDAVSKPRNFQRTNKVRNSIDGVEASDEDPKLPYSIDAYRSTRVKEIERPNVKQVIVRNEDVGNRDEEPRGSGGFSFKQKMKILTGEMNMQQTVIHQASQALNCCTDEEHGKGSQVEAEAERLLAVAMERREALKAELDRLKGGQKRTPLSMESPSSASKGSITLQELRLPLKADFVCAIANKPESTKHSFFVMIRAGAENTVATPLASTHRGLSGDTLTFPTKFTLSDVSSDFVIDIEVYCLVQKREVCNDKKKKPSKSKAITPKRFLGITKSVQTPVMASPGGPNAVRSTNFVLVGSHKLQLSSIGNNKFPLEKVPFLCPLEGHIYLKMQCEVGSKVEERGFLTMFEDVSGFGAWHRRWCVLAGYYISYWTYPDDEKCKKPIGRINLANCTSQRVEPANREFCARPNTFELITVRPQREEDKETLVSQCQNTMCVTKNWLSADTKDERNLWMRKLNQIVVDLRMWQPGACYRPL